VRWILLALTLSVLQAADADFSKALNNVVGELKMKRAPSVDLPEAASCSKSDVSYSCEFKSKANQSSVNALESEILAKVVATLPAGWSRRTSVADGHRLTKFTDPAAKGLAVTVIGKATGDREPPFDYTVRLVVDGPR
jgi:hypothetical protein